MLYIDKDFIAYWVYKWMDAFIVQTNGTVNTSRISSISETKLLPLLVQNSLSCNDYHNVYTSYAILLRL